MHDMIEIALLRDYQETSQLMSCHKPDTLTSDIIVEYNQTADNIVSEFVFLSYTECLGIRYTAV